MTDQEWAKVLEIRKRCLDRYKLAQDSGQDSWRRLGVSEPEPHAVESMIFAEVLQWTSELFFDADETEPAPAKVLGVAQLQTQLNEARAEVKRLRAELAEYKHRDESMDRAVNALTELHEEARRECEETAEHWDRIEYNRLNRA